MLLPQVKVEHLMGLEGVGAAGAGSAGLVGRGTRGVGGVVGSPLLPPLERYFRASSLL